MLFWHLSDSIFKKLTQFLKFQRLQNLSVSKVWDLWSHVLAVLCFQHADTPLWCWVLNNKQAGISNATCRTMWQPWITCHFFRGINLTLQRESSPIQCVQPTAMWTLLLVWQWNSPCCELFFFLLRLTAEQGNVFSSVRRCSPRCCVTFTLTCLTGW